MLGIDDFALRRGPVYATVIIDAETGGRVDVLPGRTADASRTGCASIPGSRSSAGTARPPTARRSAGAARRGAGQRPLAPVAQPGRGRRKEVAAHSACWAKGSPAPGGKRAETTRERWQQVHDLLSKGVGLLECSRRLGLALNTVKRYARADGPSGCSAPRVPAHPRRPLPRPPAQAARRGTRGPGSAAPARDQGARLPRQRQPPGPLPQPGPRRRRPAAPGTPQGSPAPAHQAGEPDRTDSARRLRGIASACPEMTALASLIRDFAALLTPARATRPSSAVDHHARAADLPHLHSFTRGLDLDSKAATAALTLPYHNGRTEGVNTKTKMIKTADVRPSRVRPPPPPHPPR